VKLADVKLHPVSRSAMGIDSPDATSALAVPVTSSYATGFKADETPHVCVCVCTYKRPQYLQRLLGKLSTQETDGLFTYSIVIADNDRLRSAEAVVTEFAASCPIPFRYCVESEQNIAMARNRAVTNANGEFIAFIDDDEFPEGRWLLTLFQACRKYGVDGVLGPVRPHYDQGTPGWVIKGKFYDRPSYKTGFVIDPPKGRTGNVLLKRSIFAAIDEPFRAQFQTGEDQDFFRRMIEKGHVFIWCEDAVAYEVVPPIRWKRSFMLRRAFLRGGVSPLHSTFGVRDVLKSIIAVPAYAVALPFALVSGQHRFMTLLIKLCDHLGRLLACLGIRPVKVAYVTE
jgi:succinoglycan biosynthesis protein ExoM